MLTGAHLLRRVFGANASLTAVSLSVSESAPATLVMRANEATDTADDARAVPAGLQ